MAFTKPRSHEWFERRSHFNITGSKTFEAIGLETLQNLQKHYGKVVRNIDENISEEVQGRMDYGIKSEINAAAT